MKWTLSLLVLMALLAGAFVHAETSEVALADSETDADELAIDVEAEDEVEDEVEADDEDEAEAEEEEEEEETEEAEDEEEEAAEEEADDEAEAEEVVQLETDAGSEFEAALGENEAGEWHVYSKRLTEQAHEGICQAAYEGLLARERGYFDIDKLKHGAIWNDMPSGSEKDEANMIADGHMDVDTWARLFTFTGNVNDLVFNVHYGCLQHWHSMAPIQRLQAKDKPSTRIVFTNGQVKQFIVAQLKEWYSTAMQKPKDKVRMSWYVGHILHAIQDSYPRGHVVRASTTSECGDIILFQGYDAQHGNKAHATADHSPKHADKESDPTLDTRYRCAVGASLDVLRVAGLCISNISPENPNPAACRADAINSILERVYKLAPNAANRIAGGSDARFAAATVPTDTANFVKEVVNGVTLYNLKSTKLWNAKGSEGVWLCGGAGGTADIQTKVKWGLIYSSGTFQGYTKFQSKA